MVVSWQVDYLWGVEFVMRVEWNPIFPGYWVGCAVRADEEILLLVALLVPYYYHRYLQMT
jgi:hypothetical protein